MRKFKVTINGNQYVVDIEEISESSQDVKPAPDLANTPVPKPSPSQPAAAPSQKPAPDASGNIVVAQMPGTVTKINVSIGDQVSRGQRLLILEAMKMENDIVAPQDGVVGEIRVDRGASVNSGDVLVIFN